MENIQDDAIKRLITLMKTDLKNKSNTNHNHDSVYSKIHDHPYASNSHNHDSIYSKLGHTHDDRYYTESEINTRLNAKSNTDHSHSYAFSTTGTYNERMWSFCNIDPGNVASFCRIIDYTDGYRLMFLSDFISKTGSSYVPSVYIEDVSVSWNIDWLQYKFNLPYSFLNDQYMVVGNIKHDTDMSINIDISECYTNYFKFRMMNVDSLCDKTLNTSSWINEGHNNVTKVSFILYGKY